MKRREKKANKEGRTSRTGIEKTNNKKTDEDKNREKKKPADPDCEGVCFYVQGNCYKAGKPTNKEKDSGP